jgi:hypothetical protein
MHWRTAGLWVLSLGVLTACPEEFGKGGRIDQAAHQDAVELMQRRCSQDDFRRYCAEGKKQSEDCVKHCGKQ